MKIVNKPINELNPAEYNPRQINKKQYNDLKTSIEKFGLVDPILINQDGTIIGGHQRLRVMQELTRENVPCIILDLSKEQEKELNIRLNKSGGEWDMDLLCNFEVDELKDWGFKDIELGFNIDKIVEGNIEDDHIPEVKETRVKLGDIWELGKHRLMCGDSTKESDVEKLMNGQKADMVFTDPPYGLGGYGGRKNMDLKNDDGSYELIKSFYNLPIYDKVKEVYIWGNHINLFKHIEKQPKDTIVWKKNNFGLGKGYRGQYELCFYYGHFNGSDSDVWEVKRDTNYLHPTQKPIDLILRAIKNSDPKTVLDLFLGSGSTLIGCEKTNRICYGMELDTKYCDVIIERWEQFTGQKAKKCGV